MDRLKAQENQAEIRKLRELLRSVPQREKKEHEWQLLENTLFARLDKGETIKTRKTDFFIFHPFQRLFQGNMAPLGLTGALVLLITVGLLFKQFQFSSDNLKFSRVIGIEGEVILHTQDGSGKEIIARQDEIDKSRNISSGLDKNQVLETGNNATLVVQIDRESHFILSQKSKLTVRDATTKSIVLYLHKGEILCSVGKRRRNQTFKVLTPNTVSKVVGTIFRISTFKENPEKRITDLAVLEGEVEISNHEKYLGTDILTTGESISISNKEFSQVHGIGADQVPIHAISMVKLLKDMGAKDSEQHGILDITTDPQGAEVIIKNKIIGKTPLLVKYPAGSYNLTLKKNGFELWAGKVDVIASEISFVNASLSSNNLVTATTGDNSLCINHNKPARRKQIQKVKKRHTVAPKSSDQAYVMNPAFVEALVQMTIGEFQKALAILDSLKDLPEIGFSEKIRILNKISDCYKGMGNFDTNLKRLTRRYSQEKNQTVRGNLLWEIIIVRANCLGDYSCAEKDLLTYIAQHHDGGWIESAYMKLGEIRYMSENFSKAVDTYKQYVSRFNNGRFVENAVYLVANLQRVDLEDYKEAVKWYTMLIDNYPSSNYVGNAIFERAQCYKKQNQDDKARSDYKKYLRLFPDGHWESFCRSSLTLKK